MNVPQIGDGATILGWSHRWAGTVIALCWSKSGQTVYVTVQEDRAIRTDTNGMSESQSYRYERDPNGDVWDIKSRPNGKWTVRYKKDNKLIKSSFGVRFGQRDHYHDYSF